jgi:hypothetical protein
MSIWRKMTIAIEVKIIKPRVKLLHLATLCWVAETGAAGLLGFTNLKVWACVESGMEVAGKFD